MKNTLLIFDSVVFVIRVPPVVLFAARYACQGFFRRVHCATAIYRAFAEASCFLDILCSIDC